MELYEAILEKTEQKLWEAVEEGWYKSEAGIHCVCELMGIANRGYKIMCMDSGEEEPEGGMFSRNSYQGQGGQGGNSNRSRAYGNGGSGGSYEGGSYRRGGSRRSMRGGSYRNSRHDEESFVKKMQEMREYAPDEQTKMEIDKLLAQMGQ